MEHSTLRLQTVVFDNRIASGFIVQYRSVPGPVAGITTSQSSSRPPVEESSPAHIEIRLSTQLGSTPIFCAISSVDIPERRRRSTSSSRQTSPLFSMTYLPFNDGSMVHHYQLTCALKPQQEAWRRTPIYLALPHLLGIGFLGVIRFWLLSFYPRSPLRSTANCRCSSRVQPKASLQ